MLQQQNTIQPQPAHLNKYEHKVLDNITTQNAKIKTYLYSFRQNHPKPYSQTQNQSFLAKYSTKSENKYKKRQNHIYQSKKERLKSKDTYDKLSEDQSLFKKKFGAKVNYKAVNVFQGEESKQKQMVMVKSNFSNEKKNMNPQNQEQQYKDLKTQDQVNTFNFQPKKKNINFRVRSKFNDNSNERPRDYFQKIVSKKKIKMQQNQYFQVESIESLRLVAHIHTLEQLTFQSAAEDIFPFFQSIYQVLNLKPVKTPTIKRYRSCIYYGQGGVDKKMVYQGMIWHFKKVFYYGQFVDGKKHGLGMEIKFDEFNVCIWKGKFCHGQKTGYFSIESKQFKYYGMLKDGQFHGQGHLISVASQYRGHFCDNLKEGMGLERFTNKSQYKGQYFNNLFDGQGELKTSSYYYKGNFKQGMPDGQGYQRTAQYEYLGDFVMGKKQGKGKLKLLSDGTYIECEFKNGLIVGDNIKDKKVKNPKQLILSDYFSKDLQALNEQSQEGTIQHMLNEINNPNSNSNQFQ